MTDRLLVKIDGAVVGRLWLLSTRIYTHYGLTSDLAMKVGGESNPDAVQKKTGRFLPKRSVSSRGWCWHGQKASRKKSRRRVCNFSKGRLPRIAAMRLTD
ncbi:MAG: hypothetical protein RQ723_06160 [Desulfuromonadales bacterium]|nr:hypothetical protein [Desulfuromonadales bacterium]